MCKSVAQSLVKSPGTSRDTSLLTTNRTEEVRVEAGRRRERDTRGEDDEEGDEERAGRGCKYRSWKEKEEGKGEGRRGGVKSGRRKWAIEDERRRGKQGV